MKKKNKKPNTSKLRYLNYYYDQIAIPEAVFFSSSSSNNYDTQKSWIRSSHECTHCGKWIITKRWRREKNICYFVEYKMCIFFGIFFIFSGFNFKLNKFQLTWLDSAFNAHTHTHTHQIIYFFFISRKMYMIMIYVVFAFDFLI